MTAPSIGIKDLLVADSIGKFENATGSEFAIMLSLLPAQPDNVIAIFDSGGLPANPKWLLDYPDVSIIVRANDYQTCYNKMKEVKDKLLGLPNQDLNGDHWSGVIQVSAPAFIGRDEKERCQMSSTFRLFFEPANSAGDNRLPL